MQVRAGVVERELTAPDVLDEARVGQDGSVRPVGLLDSPVLVVADAEREPDGAYALLRVVEAGGRVEFESRAALDQPGKLEPEVCAATKLEQG